MTGELSFDNIDSFINTLHELNINKIAFTVIDEKRAQNTGDKSISVVQMRKLELLAYKNAIIYKCIIYDADFNSLYKKMTDNGFEVKKRSRNII